MNVGNVKIENMLPPGVKTVLELLRKNNVEAYIVGGCVRDILCGKKPADFDVTSSADIPKIMQIFSGYRVVETGVKFGTVTVVCGGLPVEITQMRKEGAYSDCRRPDFVAPTLDIKEDLSRRDFTFNSMAWNAQKGLVDFFGGKSDLENGILKTVGDPDARFGEDALRILRAMRFAATMPCNIEPRTANAIMRNYTLLAKVSPERILGELWRILCGKNAENILRQFEDILFFIMPELLPMRNFEQKSLYHIYDVWEHTLHVVSAAPRDKITRMAALLHDAGKPHCMKIDSYGHGHFKTHAIIGAEITDKILTRLRASGEDKKAVWEIVRYHDDDIPQSDYGVRKYLSFLGETQMRRFLDLQEADSRAKSERSDTEFAADLRRRLETILRNGDAVNLSGLAINGNDLRAMGITGEKIGTVLNSLLEAVWLEPWQNNREKLLELSKEIKVKS